jgi:M6 family metalloprotease-like protein
VLLVAAVKTGKSIAAAAAAAPAPAPIQGVFKGLTVLIEFQDQRATYTRAEIFDLLNMRNYSRFGNTGSVFDYFYRVSNGQVEYTNTIPDATVYPNSVSTSVGYFRAANEKAYYDNNDNPTSRVRELILEALTDLKNKGFDFSQITYDGNEAVAVNFLYAGACQSEWATGLWPHMSTLDTNDADPFDVGNGRYIGRYQMTDLPDPPHDLKIGTICHETGHLL